MEISLIYSFNQDNDIKNMGLTDDPTSILLVVVVGVGVYVAYKAGLFSALLHPNLGTSTPIGGGATTAPTGGHIYPVVSTASGVNVAGTNQQITYASSGKAATSHRSDVSFQKQNIEATVYLSWPANCTGGGHPELAIKFWGPGHTDATCCYCYTCLSEDTEVLTMGGWEQFNNNNKFKYKEILCYNVEKDTYHFEVPQKWQTYPSIKDTLYRIKSDNTDQLVTKNHRCLVEQEGKLLFQQAQNIPSWVSMPYLEALPMLQESISDISIREQSEKPSESRNVLLNKLQTEGKHQKALTGTKEKYTSNVRREKSFIERIDEGREQSLVERGCDIQTAAWKLYRSGISEMPRGIHINERQEGICTNPQISGSQTSQEVIIENRSSPSYRSQSKKQQSGQSSIILLSKGSWNCRTFPRTYKTTLATVTRENYEGLVFCPTVSTGCFIAKRNGKIFLTGNSAVPSGGNLQLGFGGEGPHPSTTTLQKVAKSIPFTAGKKYGIKGVIWSTSPGKIHQETWYDDGSGKWQLAGSYDRATCGQNKTSATIAANAQVEFRIDCANVTYSGTDVVEIRPPTGGGATTGPATTAGLARSFDVQYSDMSDNSLDGIHGGSVTPPPGYYPEVDYDHSC